MRIGELAGLAGITTRAVRHYHQVGLLPEPLRQANGYREYTLRDAALLARIRRLTELGLSLEEVRDVVAEDAGRDLVEVLTELDADLARQEAAIRERRCRLAELLAQAGEAGRLPAEGPVSPELAALFADMAAEAERRTGPEPQSAAAERRLLALLDGPGGHAHQGWLAGLQASFGADPQAMARAYDVYALLDELLSAAPDDPRVERTAQAMADAVPDAALGALNLPPQDGGIGEGRGGFADAFLAEFAPAQAAAVLRAIELLRERAR
ncbi:MerR family transcriptional regulator [Kitasatospora sp. NPDC048365]|uniref:MerR family transcriptional regulator n=1 Tax=Kitasatospora sp. NPDC048365 TaxID=3364050 RepID=UPI00371C01BB